MSRSFWPRKERFSVPHSILCIIVALLLPTLEINGAPDDDFKQSLLRVVHDAANGFQSLRGRNHPDVSDADSTEYAAKVTLPGALECSITVYSDPDHSPYYSCSMGRGSEASRQYSGVVEAIARALGSTYKGKPYEGKHIAEGTKFETFDSDDPSVRVYVNDSRNPSLVVMISKH